MTTWILAAALAGLLFSRLHFHFHLTLEVSHRRAKGRNTPEEAMTRRDRARRPVNLGGGTPASRAPKGGDAQGRSMGAHPLRPVEPAAATASTPAKPVKAPAGPNYPAGVPTIRHHSDVSRALQAAQDKAEADIASALENLGVGRQKAQNIARDAMQQASDFDARLKWAIGKAA